MKGWKKWQYRLLLGLAVAAAFGMKDCPVTAKDETEAVIATEEAFPGSIREEGLEAQIRAYFEARAEGDPEKMGEALGKEDRVLGIRSRVLSENGMRDIRVTRMALYPAGKRRIVFVSYEMYVELYPEEAAQRKKVTLPGLEIFLAEPDGRGGWILSKEMPEEEETAEWIRACLDREETGNWINEINRAYEEALEASPETVDWIEEVREKMDKEIAEELMKELEADKRHSYKVKKGDSLWRIAGELLGDSGLWKELYAENRDQIGENPDLIRPGTELTVPR